MNSFLLNKNVEYFLTDEGRLEKGFRAPEPLVSNSDDLPVGELVALLQRAGAGGSLHLLLEVQGNVTQFFLKKRVKRLGETK